MLEDLRRSLRDLLGSPASREDRREALYRMRDTLVQAKVGVGELRDAIELTRRRLAAEQRELETVRRRKRLAGEIGDAETVAVAERYERQHAERVGVLERKLEAQEGELGLTEREIAAMSAELKAAMAGVGAAPIPGAGLPGEDPLRDEAREALDELARAQRRTAAQDEAEEKLAALKRRMGK